MYYHETVFRSHYDQLALGVLVMKEEFGDEVTTVTETGWSTRFDGGQQVPEIRMAVSVYAEASHWVIQEGREPFMYARVTQLWLPGCPPGSRETSFLRREGFSLEEAERAGFYDCLRAKAVVEETPEADDQWMVVRPEDVPDEVRRILKKTEETSLGLFGQGGDFFDHDLREEIMRE